MVPLSILGLATAALLAVGWRLSQLASRLDRAHRRAERAWAGLDRALQQRAEAAASAALEADPATTLLVCDAAAAALELGLGRRHREQAESDLTRVLQATSISGAVIAESERAALARRLYNDAVSTARVLRDRRIVRLFRLAGHARAPQSFEMAELSNEAPITASTQH